MRPIIATFFILCLFSVNSTVKARTHIHIVGSSTVYPFATVVAEKFGKISRFKTPIIESTGTGGGMKLFCKGIGISYPDFINASRRITQSEFNECHTNGVTEIIEVQIGYDGIVIGNSRESQKLALTKKEIFLALAKNVPNPDGSQSFIDTPYRTWKDVNKKLPDIKIEVLGPSPTSGTRDAFVELVMEKGCEKFDWIKSMKQDNHTMYNFICHTIRGDGSFIEIGENDNLIIKKLRANSKALGVFGFNFLDQNQDLIQGSVIDDISPNFESIYNGSYSVSRPLYFYAKKAHIGLIPGIEEYMSAFINESSFGEDGYLIEKGLIPMPTEERVQCMFDINHQVTLKL